MDDNKLKALYCSSCKLILWLLLLWEIVHVAYKLVKTYLVQSEKHLTKYIGFP